MVTRNKIGKVVALVVCVLMSLGGMQVGAETIKLKVAFVDWNNVSREITEQEIMPEFEKQYPNIQVEATYYTWSGYYASLISSFQGYMGPDIFQGGTTLGPMVAANGWIMPLDDFIAESPDFEWDDFFEVARNKVTIGGKISGIPYRADTRPLWYRESFLLEAGVDVPQTWEDLKNVAVKSTKRDDKGKIVRAGWNFANRGDKNTHQTALHFLYQAGGSILDPTWKKVVINDPKGVESFDFINELVNELEVCPSPWGIEQVGGVMPIVSGKAATSTALQTSVIWEMAKYNPDEYNDLKAALPLKHRKQVANVYINDFFISSQSKYPKESWALLQHLTNLTNMSRVCKAQTTIPTRKSAIELGWVKSDQKLAISLETAGVSVPFPPVAGMAEFWPLIRDAIGKVLIEHVSAKESLDEAAKEMEKVIIRHGDEWIIEW